MSKAKLDLRRVFFKAGVTILVVAILSSIITGFMLSSIYNDQLAGIAEVRAESPVKRVEKVPPSLLDDHVKLLMKREDIVFIRMTDGSGRNLAPSGKQDKKVAEEEILVIEKKISYGPNKIKISIGFLKSSLKSPGLKSLRLVWLILGITLALFFTAMTVFLKCVILPPLGSLKEMVNSLLQYAAPFAWRATKGDRRFPPP